MSDESDVALLDGLRMRQRVVVQRDAGSSDISLEFFLMTVERSVVQVVLSHSSQAV